MKEDIADIISYLVYVHSVHADGCKASCSEREIGYHQSSYGESYWFVRFGGYCLGDLSRSEEVQAATLEHLLPKLTQHIEDAIKRQEENL